MMSGLEWKETIDDASLTGNEGTEADISRAIAVDEETLLDPRNEPEYSGREELVETMKLLFAGGFAGAISKSATAPLARLTILYQVSHTCPYLTWYALFSLTST